MPISINPPFICNCACGVRFEVSQVADLSAIHIEQNDVGTNGPRGITCPKCGKTILKHLDELGLKIGDV